MPRELLMNQLFNENCLTTMSRLPNNSVDLIVTSPPYDEIISNKEYKNLSTEDFKKISIDLFRILKPTGCICWVVGDQTINGSETLTSFSQALYFKNIGFKHHDTMIYEKSGFSNPSKNRYHQVFEYIFVLYKESITFNPIIDKPNKYIGIHGGEKSVRASYGKRYNIWRYNNGGGNSTKDKILHPAIMPEKLAEDLIKSFSNPGDLVYDPFSGYGTTCKAAKNLNRKYIGSEISEKYYKLSLERIK